MEARMIISEDIQRFVRHLKELEYAQGSVEKYLRDIRAFKRWSKDRQINQDLLVGWKAHLQLAGYQPGTINGMLASLNCLFKFMDWNEFRFKYLKIQRRLFRSEARELTRSEYARLTETARELGNCRLALLMETVCATGIRVSEMRYITVEAVRTGWAEICLKGKIRTILLPNKLRKKLQKYAKKQKIISGEIFLTRNRKPLSRRQIWAEMKALCKQAGVVPSKVFPHNLRHLFARTFYQAYKDVSRLADVLGHSSMETTRLYLISTSAEHVQQIERLGLVS